MKQIKLEPAAALMLQWGKEAFSGEVINNFVNHIDLSSGKSLIEECNTICSWYNQVVVNGKRFISGYLNNLLENSANEHLIIIPGAGKSPLALEILTRHPEKVHKIIEIDITGMDEKVELYYNTFPNHPVKLNALPQTLHQNPFLRFSVQWYTNIIRICPA